MHRPEIDSYVPASRHLDGKDALPGRECHEDFALSYPAREYRLYAARGPRLHAGQRLELPEEERRYLESELTAHHRIAVCAQEGVAVICTELFEATGLLPVILPEGDPAMIAQCLGYLGRQDTVMSRAVGQLSGRVSGRPEDCYAMLREQLDACDRIFRPEKEPDFRLHCARTARFAGCRVDATALPAEPLPIAPADWLRWTALLLCTFLTLRGESAAGPALQLGQSDVRAFRLRLSHTSERKTAGSGRHPFGFLELPCFSGMTLRHTGATWLLECELPRAAGASLLRSGTPEPPALLCLEIMPVA